MSIPRHYLALFTLLFLVAACGPGSLSPNPLPTSSLRGQQVTDVSKTCRASLDGLAALTRDLHTPRHLATGQQPYRQSADFDPNRYFTVLDHLSLQPGYALDYVYLLGASRDIKDTRLLCDRSDVERVAFFKVKRRKPSIQLITV